MTDSNKDPNSQRAKAQPKILSNSLRLKSPHNVKRRQNVSTLLNRLPFLRTLNEAQNQLLAIAPVWQQWCSNQHIQNKTNPIISEFASLASVNADELTISCKQSSIATILKFQQSDLLETLHSAGFNHIQKLRIQMSLAHLSVAHNFDQANELSSKRVNQKPSDYTEQSSSTTKAWPKPSAASLKSIEAAQSLIKNEQLAASLKRLAETLKKAR